MNISKELTEIIEILEQQRKMAIKTSYKSSDYGFGQIKSFNIALNLLQDLEKRWKEHEKNIAKHEDPKPSIKKTPDLLQVV